MTISVHIQIQPTASAEVEDPHEPVSLPSFHSLTKLSRSVEPAGTEYSQVLKAWQQIDVELLYDLQIPVGRFTTEGLITKMNALQSAWVKRYGRHSSERPYRTFDQQQPFQRSQQATQYSYCPGDSMAQSDHANDYHRNGFHNLPFFSNATPGAVAYCTPRPIQEAYKAGYDAGQGSQMNRFVNGNQRYSKPRTERSPQIAIEDCRPRSR